MALNVPDILYVSRDNVLQRERPLQLLCLFLWCPTILDLIRVIFFYKIPILTDIHLYVIPFTITLLSLFCIPVIARIFKFTDFILLLIPIVYYEWCLYSYISQQPYLEIYEDQFILQSLPYYLIGLIVKPHEFKRTFFWGSTFFIVYAFIYFTLMNGGSANRDMSEEQMHLAYLVLPHLLYVLWYTLTEFSLVSLILTLLGIFELFSYGNRGSLMCLAVFFIIYAIYSFHRGGKSKMIVIVTLSLSVMIFSDEVMITLQSFFFNVRSEYSNI